ncbi:hypothetical protein EGW08_011189 [Elysia chlorotica]|uniref:Uncharacterized protein n=1 Tax=Elysia chlorotica TaxID=188477 RepID=A0A433THN6_ELYCH|nr:hypothetical protein EGW08_011189 [Elysia chlorotica]
MKAPRGHDLIPSRGRTPQTSGRMAKDLTDHQHTNSSVNYNCDNNNIETDDTSMDDMHSSYYILEPHPDFSDYAPSTPEDLGNSTTEPTQKSLSVTITSSPLCNVGPPSTSPMSSPLLSDSLDYRRRLGQSYQRQFSHNQHPQHHYLQEQQQQQQHQYHHQQHQHRQYTRSKSEDTGGQGYYSVEDTIKVGACTCLSILVCNLEES